MICRQYCDTVALIDQADDLDMSLFSGAHTVGITAGASTPAWIIKEVNNKMTDEIKVEAAPEETFAELLEQSLKTLNNGDKVTGTVMAIGSTEVEVDLGTKHTAYIPLDEFSTDPSVKPEDCVKVGDQVEAVVVHVNDSEGVIRLSKKRLEAGKAWEEIEAAVDSKEVMEGLVTEENKGGIVASVKGVRVFVPASQTGIPKGGDLGELVKKTVKLRITEVNRARRRVVGSIRSVASEQRKAAQEKIWSEIAVGNHYHGVVKSLTSYGAFVDIGGVDGMVHVSELSWNRIKNPSEVVKVGDEIDVFVIALDPEKKKISLGYKTEETNPWVLFTKQFQVGDVTKVKIVKLMTFGAFAEIIPGVDGLIHISQIADRRIGKPEDVLSEGQEVDVKIIDIDQEHKRISLSIRALLNGQSEEAPADGE
jgi:4-hydroxy-3-methylbut-2-enyl diphosphate reductase